MRYGQSFIQILIPCLFITCISVSRIQVQAQHAAALAEDPNVFSYDDVIDTIKESKQDVKQSEKLERQSRYISTLMKRAKDREREQNVCIISYLSHGLPCPEPVAAISSLICCCVLLYTFIYPLGFGPSQHKLSNSS